MFNNTFYNSSARDGGVIYFKPILNNQDSHQITDCTFSSNRADHNGGVIFFRDAGLLNIIGSHFTDNSAGDDGGVLHILNASLSITGSIFRNNRADNNGGVINCNELRNSLYIFNNTFYNSSARNGGVIYFSPFPNSQNSHQITECTFRSSSADRDGGAIYFHDAESLNIIGSHFADNSVGDDGGVLHILQASLNITGSTFSSNRTNNNGSVINCDELFIHI